MMNILAFSPSLRSVNGGLTTPQATTPAFAPQVDLTNPTQANKDVFIRSTVALQRSGTTLPVEPIERQFLRFICEGILADVVALFCEGLSPQDRIQQATKLLISEEEGNNTPFVEAWLYEVKRLCNTTAGHQTNACFYSR